MKTYFVHPQGICESTQIGPGTRIWAFAHVLPGATIGNDCNIGDHVFIENDVTIGNEVTIKPGVQIWDGLRIGNRVYIGPNATFTNALFPRPKEYPDTFSQTVIEDGVSIGANATILSGLSIGARAMIGAGAVVSRNVPPNAIVDGNPAIITGYVNINRSDKVTTFLPGQFDLESFKEPIELGVKGCKIWPLPKFADMRGDLVPVQFNTDLPFIPIRHFFVFNVPGGNVRGEHAHKTCDQFMVALNGALSIVIDDGTNACEVRLDHPSIGLFVPSNIWAIQYKFSENTILSVYASHPYDPDDYIRSYDQYLAGLGDAQ